MRIAANRIIGIFNGTAENRILPEEVLAVSQVQLTKLYLRQYHRSEALQAEICNNLLLNEQENKKEITFLDYRE